ncbi:MAG: hypothetical protein QOG80_3466 [Pseudonocardiales bacterium]|jgi:hypothetical protein|nr:hypothetical protein [Pseudonocardiales bacterium]
MELLVQGPRGYVAACVRLRDRLVVALHADEIDRRLAQGASPEATLESALRARMLTRRRSRRRLARALDRAVTNATTPAVAGARRARIASASMRDVAADIAELRTRLMTRDLTSVRGIARTRLLLVDGGGPVHNVRAAGTLRATIRQAIDAFDTF